MPQGTQRTGKSLAHVLFLSAALSLLSTLVRRERRQLVLTARDRRKKVRVAPRRIAASLAFATLFFAGAALSAGAGNGVVQMIDPVERVGARALTPRPTRRPTRRRPPIPPDPAEDPSAKTPSNGQRAEGTSQASSDNPSAQTSRPETPPVSQAPAPTGNTQSNTHAAGVRADAQGAAPRRALEAGCRLDRTRAAGQRPDGSRTSPAPEDSARDRGGQGSLRYARRASGSPRQTSRTWPPPCGCTATYRIRRRPRAV